MSQVDIPFLEDADTRQALNQLMWEASDATLAIYESSDLGITTKDDQSPVTKADLTAHHVLVTGLSALTPDIPVVSEEDPDSFRIPETHQRYWLIDPLDGTKEFINRNGEFTCNLALIDSHKTIYGLVSVPVRGLLYSGGESLGSYRRERTGSETPIYSRSENKLTRVVVSKSHLNTETKAYIASIHGETEILQAGSSLKFLLVAEGRADVYPRLGPTCEWDTAAAHAVVEGANGRVCQLNGENLIYGKTSVLNPHFIVKSPVV